MVNKNFDITEYF